MKELDFINKALCHKNQARAYTSSFDEAKREYY